ncbi:unnamed protein product [Linum trigynum]|uniref:Uncharacterized protein n=1 Tax=Linum trigynum TaxID=586398 RepID=A0AAV2DBQ6_9ROSI
MATLKTTSTNAKELSKGQGGQQHGHVRDHVNINTPYNMATFTATSTKVKEISKGQRGQQHGHVRDHANINTLTNHFRPIHP